MLQGEIGFHIGDAGATEISKALEVNTVLTVLNLKGSQIGDAGLTKIFEALSANTVLTTMKLDGGEHDFGAAGATKI